MKITRLIVKNFRSVESADIYPSGLNVFIGQNNHGKTNLFEAIEWFYNNSGDWAQIPYMRDQALEVSVEVEFSGIQSGIETVKNEKTRESFRKFADGNDVIRVIRRKSDGGKRSLWDEAKGEWSAKNFAGFDKAFNDCLPRLQYVATSTRLADISKYGRKTPIGEMLSGVLTTILESSTKYREFRDKFDEVFGSEQSEVRVELNSLGGKVKDHLEQQFPECAKVAFDVIEPAFDDLLKNFETSIDDGIETTATEKGDGMQRALMLAIIKTYSDYRREKDELGKRFLFLIDEAELHLHPSAQRQLKDALLLLAKNGDQVFVNTHSSVMVADEHDQQGLFKVHKVTKSSQIMQISASDKPHVIYELMGGSPADLLFPNNFLIVEGRTEYELLRGVISRHYFNKPTLQIIFAGGDTEKQRRSMDAINTVFTPLYQTPVYRDCIVLLCDKPNATQQKGYDKFRKDYPNLKDDDQIFIQSTAAIEEAYPAPWNKTVTEIAAMKPGEKTELGKTVGASISKEDFEANLSTAFAALSKAWQKAHK